MNTAQVSGAVPPVEKSIVVPWTPDEAFRRFTEQIGSWWPLETFAVSSADVVTCAFEPRIGGRLYETHRDGTEHPWGRVLAWEPGRRIAFTWHPGKHEDAATEVEVRFLPETGGTRVELVHSRWERVSAAGMDPRETRGGYDEGWVLVMGRYAETA